MLINESDCKYLEQIENRFVKNMNKAFQCNAIDEAAKEGTPLKQAVLRRRKLVMKINKIDIPNYRAHLIAQFTQAAVPLLKKKFGQEALINALPIEARNQKAVEICELTGAKKLAKLCRLGMK